MCIAAHAITPFFPRHQILQFIVCVLKICPSHQDRRIVYKKKTGFLAQLLEDFKYLVVVYDPSNQRVCVPLVYAFLYVELNLRKITA